jgi:hypothetical protein
MSDIYKTPESQLDVSDDKVVAQRPKSVVIISAVFFFLAMLDFGFSINSGFIHQTQQFDTAGNITGSSFKVELLWLAMYGIGAGLMRGGKFARVIACFVGVILLIIPGVFLIYFLFFTDAKNYFEHKNCGKCGNTTYLNKGFPFKGISCKRCKNKIELQNS